MMRALFVICLALVAWAAPARPAHALGCILFGCDCTISATDIDFDDFTPLLGGNHDAIGQVHIACTGLLIVGAGVVVQIDDGQWGTFAARKMRSGAGQLINYNIYTTAARTTVWGDGTGGSQSIAVQGGLIVLGSWSANRDMFGRVAANAAQRPGDYADTVIVRVIW